MSTRRVIPAQPDRGVVPAQAGEFASVSGGATLFDLIAGADAAAPCLLAGGTTISYGEFRDRVLRTAGGLRAAGIARGECVAVWLPNTPDWLVLAFACARLGACVLSLNMRFGAGEIGDFVSRAQAKAIVYGADGGGKNCDGLLASIDPSLLASLRVAVTADGRASGLGGVKTVGLPTLAAAQPHPAADGQGSDACIIFSSSGTTSRPKLVVHSQERVARHATDVTKVFGLRAATSRVFPGVPFCGAFGYTVALTALAAHAAVLVEEVFDAERATRLLDERSVTHMFGTNDMVDRMLQGVPADWRPRTLQAFGHANFTPALDRVPAKAEAHGVRLRGCFGMSETLALTATQPADGGLQRRAQSGGLLNCLHAEARVRSLETGELLPPGEPGELEIRTPNVMIGYLGDEAATRKAFSDDGFLRTGDLAHLEADGGFTHLSRIGDVIRVGGFLVNPLEIEEVVAAVPGIEACQVVEVEAAKSTRPVAFIIRAPGATVADEVLSQACRSRLATFKIPIRFYPVDAFPTTQGPNGIKVRKAELRQEAQRRLKEETA